MHARMEENRGSFLKEILQFAVIAAIVVFPVRLFIAQPFIVSGASMDPTFDTGQYLIVDEISYRFEEPKRGEVVIFRYPLDPSKFFIKRIIGLPGETVSVRHGNVRIAKTDGSESFTLNEQYVVNKGNGINTEVTLGRSEYFVMGDNRPESSDSRVWGPLPKENIIGRAVIRLLPLSQAEIFPGVSPQKYVPQENV